MNDSDYTLTSPISALEASSKPLLCLSVVWHPDSSRIGEQSVASGNALEISRYAPLFRHPGKPQALALGHAGVSREPVRILRHTQDKEDCLELIAPNSRMVLEVQGQLHTAENPALQFTPQQIEAGVIISLGRAVILCLHYLRCLPKFNPVPGLIGIGQAAMRTRDLIRQAAQTEQAVLLLGETGTGKEVAAQAIHGLSRRASQTMHSVNMAALNESLAAADLFGAAKGAYTGAQSQRLGWFAQAQESSLFLDEIGNTPQSVQPMLLRVLENGQYRPLGAQHDLHSNARIIAATDQDVYQAGFNQALLRRLENFVIPLPPLRTRREDIGVLILHLLTQCEQTLPAAQLPASLISQMAIYDWPGNIRQLRHVVQRCVLALALGETPDFAALVAMHKPSASAAALSSASAMSVPAGAGAEVSSLATNNVANNAANNAPASPSKQEVAEEPSKAASGHKKLAEITPQDVLQAMQEHHWFIQAAAQALGISRPSMYKLLEQHPQIRRPERIPLAEIQAALAQAGQDVAACAALLQTPTEGLRRYLRQIESGVQD